MSESEKDTTINDDLSRIEEEEDEQREDSSREYFFGLYAFIGLSPICEKGALKLSSAEWLASNGDLLKRVLMKSVLSVSEESNAS